MPDNIYCYPNSNILKNKLNIRNQKELSEAEAELTFIRLKELQSKPIKGKFDYNHLKAIHKYIFQDIYEWAGKERTVEIGKGNIFCTTKFISSYAEEIFNNYYKECINTKNNKEEFIKTLAKNYGDLNALHPFREGNGRTQREFARLICLNCGYDFDLRKTKHDEMLKASKLSFDKGDNTLFEEIFKKAIKELPKTKNQKTTYSLKILSSDDLLGYTKTNYEYYDNNNENDKKKIEMFDQKYENLIKKSKENERAEMPIEIQYTPDTKPRKKNEPPLPPM